MPVLEHVSYADGEVSTSGPLVSDAARAELAEALKVFDEDVRGYAGFRAVLIVRQMQALLDERARQERVWARRISEMTTALYKRGRGAFGETSTEGEDDLPDLVAPCCTGDSGCSKCAPFA